MKITFLKTLSRHSTSLTKTLEVWRALLGSMGLPRNGRLLVELEERKLHQYTYEL